MKMNKLITSAFLNVGLHSLRLNRKLKREVYKWIEKNSLSRNITKLNQKRRELNYDCKNKMV